MNDESGMTSPHHAMFAVAAPLLQERRGGREKLVPNPKARLREQFHEVCRFKHLSLRSEEAYWGWVVRLVKHFGSKIHPKDLSGEQLAEFLTHLATVGQVAASTQNQAFHPVR
jgi:hypothetical protein